MIQTNRLILRKWIPDDLIPFAKLNADPKVMKYFPSPLSRQESDALAQKIIEKFNQQGFGFLAVEEIASKEFMGFIGLNTVVFEAPFTGAIEIGWRLASKFWNQGFATEGAKAVLNYGFNQLNLPEIVAFTTITNAPSMRVMEKIHMQRDIYADFDHPLLAKDHALKRHVLYRIHAKDWLNQKKN